jgi:hypothetical protein
MTIDLEAIKTRLAAPYAAGAYDITVRLANGRLCATVRMRDWDGSTAHDADAAVTHLLVNAPADLTALVAEVERLREMLLNAGWPRESDELAAMALRYERAAVVAALRRFEPGPMGLSLVNLDSIADAIERGDHLPTERTDNG